MKKETLNYLSKRFDIPEEDIVSYNSGICYSRIVVRTQESANKVHDSVKDNTVNGGMFDGMQLGGIRKYKNEFGKLLYDVTC